MIPGQAPADVRFTPTSGHKWLGRGMSAYDPKRTLTGRPPVPRLSFRREALVYCRGWLTRPIFTHANSRRPTTAQSANGIIVQPAK